MNTGDLVPAGLGELSAADYCAGRSSTSNGNARLLTARQVGDILNFSTGTIVDWAEAGTIPSLKVAGRLRFSENEIAAWLEQKRRTG